MRWFGSVVVLLSLAAAARPEDINALIKQLQSQNQQRRREAAKALGDVGGDKKEAIPALTAALSDKDRFVRQYSAMALGSMGPAAKGSINALKGLLDDDHEAVVDTALEALKKVGPDAVPVLCSFVESDKQNKERRRGVAHAIAEMDKAEVAKLAIPMLTKLLKDKDQDLKMDAIGDLARYGADAKAAVPTLADLLKQNNKQMRMAVMKTLTAMGPAAEPALPALQKLADDDKEKDKKVKKVAEETIKKIKSTK